MHKKIGIVQSNYIPWKGYFDLINMVDEFILYDHVQFTRSDWRNRNMIKAPSGPMWVTIPVRVKGRHFQRICDTLICSPSWNQRHWKTISQNYARARFFKEYRDIFEDLYMHATDPLLSKVNYHFLTAICALLGIRTKITWSSEYCIVYPEQDGERDRKTRRLIDVCRQSGATEYISGPAAKEYINPLFFENAGITLTYMDYSDYPEYEQLFQPFTHYVSIIDLILNVGKEAPNYMKSFRDVRADRYVPCDV